MKSMRDKLAKIRELLEEYEDGELTDAVRKILNGGEDEVEQEEMTSYEVLVIATRELTYNVDAIDDGEALLAAELEHAGKSQQGTWSSVHEDTGVSLGHESDEEATYEIV